MGTDVILVAHRNHKSFLCSPQNGKVIVLGIIGPSFAMLTMQRKQFSNNNSRDDDN
jgi:hypothetical protein